MSLPSSYCTTSWKRLTRAKTQTLDVRRPQTRIPALPADAPARAPSAVRGTLLVSSRLVSSCLVWARSRSRFVRWSLSSISLRRRSSSHDRLPIGPGPSVPMTARSQVMASMSSPAPVPVPRSIRVGGKQWKTEKSATIRSQLPKSRQSTCAEMSLVQDRARTLTSG